MKKETLLTVLVVLLVVLNVSLLAHFFFGRPKPHPPNRETHKIIIEKLHYDEQQQRQFEVLRQEQHQALKQLEERFNRVAEEYFALLKNEWYDPAAKDSLEKVMADLQRQKAHGLFGHFQKLKDLCRDDQKKTFGELLPELLHLINPPPPNSPSQKNSPPPRRN